MVAARATAWTGVPCMRLYDIAIARKGNEKDVLAKAFSTTRVRTMLIQMKCRLLRFAKGCTLWTKGNAFAGPETIHAIKV